MVGIEIIQFKFNQKGLLIREHPDKIQILAKLVNHLLNYENINKQASGNITDFNDER